MGTHCEEYIDRNGRARKALIHAVPKWFADPTGDDKLKPIAEAIVVDHNDALKRFHVELPATKEGRRWIELTPVDKRQFSGAEIVNYAGSRFGHKLPVGEASVAYDISHSAGVSFDANYGWTAVIVKHEPRGLEHVLAVFPSAEAARSYARSLLRDFSEVGTSEVRFFEGEN